MARFLTATDKVSYFPVLGDVGSEDPAPVEPEPVLPEPLELGVDEVDPVDEPAEPVVPAPDESIPDEPISEPEDEPVLPAPLPELELGLLEDEEPVLPAPLASGVELELPDEPVVPEPRVLLYAENSAALNLPLPSASSCLNCLLSSGSFFASDLLM